MKIDVNTIRELIKAAKLSKSKHILINGYLYPIKPLNSLLASLKKCKDIEAEDLRAVGEIKVSFNTGYSIGYMEFIGERV